MSRNVRALSLLVIVAALTLQFTNCGYSETATNTSNSVFNLNCDDDCIVPNKDNLQVVVNNLSSSGGFLVNGALSEFNLGGDCNEGGYPFNTIIWELYAQTNSGPTRVRGSTEMGANTRCVNGRFMLYVNLLPGGGDAVNRTGLNTGGGRMAHDLYVEIIGQETQNGTGVGRNSFKGRTRVSLIPL